MAKRRGRGSWSYNKSYRVGKHFRVNVSKKGVGYSFGVRGLRVSRGPRGTYLNAGRGGYRYSKKLASATASPAAENTSLGCLWAVLVFIAVLVFSSSFTAASVVGLLTLVVVLNLGRRNDGYRDQMPPRATETPSWDPSSWDTGQPSDARQINRPEARSSPGANKLRQKIEVTFTHDEAFQEACVSMEAIIKGFAKANKMWMITHSTANTNLKSAASETLAREVIVPDKFNERYPEYSEIEINAPTLILKRDFRHHGYWLLAPGLFIHLPPYNSDQAKGYRFHDLEATFEVTRFLETGPAPADSKVVGQTWLYLNKDGSPDRRYRDNRQVPIIEYGTISFRKKESKAVTVLQLQLSSVAAAQEVFEALPKSMTSVGSGPQEQKSPPPPEPEKPRGPYEMLGLEPSASEEEIRQAYRDLARRYHPDRVAHLAPEFVAVAEKRMKEINEAYWLLTKGGK